MLWTGVAVAGMACLVGAALLFAGPALALAVAGLLLIVVALDGRS